MDFSHAHHDLLVFIEYLLPLSLKKYILTFQIMIDIGNLLDFCGISYTEKQLAKLEKLLKKMSLQQFDSNGSTLDSKDKSRYEDFHSETKLKPMEKFDFKPDLNYDNTIKEEILEESDIEIKEEPVNDPFASLETFNNSENVSDMVHEEDMESIDSSHHEHVKSVHDGMKPLRSNDYNGSKSEDFEFEIEIKSESSESSNPETATKSDTSSNMSSVQVLDQVDCNDPSCVEHGMGDSPDEEENVEISNNNGNVSIKSHEKLLLNQSEENQNQFIAKSPQKFLQKSISYAPVGSLASAKD